jgi:hypothetical protein
MLVRIALIALIFTGCSDSFGDAQKLDSITGWEAFITDNPKNPKRSLAEVRLEELYLKAARDGKALEGYDIYLTKFPKGNLVNTANTERREFLLDWARETDTPEAWEKYIAEYPTGNTKAKREARRRLNMAKNKNAIEFGPIKMEQVNMAEDPDGPLNGYGFYVDVTNKSDKPIQRLNVQIAYLDDDGGVLKRASWPAVAERLPAGLPMPEGFSKPIAPGEARQWEWTDGEMPQGWSKKAKVIATDIKFAE